MNKEEYRKLWHDRIEEFAFRYNNNLHNLVNYKLYNEIKNTLLKIVYLNGDLATKLKTKFDKGMEEHGADFDRVDFDAEIENEVLDICNYLIGKHHSTTSKLQKNER